MTQKSDGLLLVDKPTGPTSFDVVAQVRRRLGVRKVGHAGTLDPMATGLLPVLVGEGTKLVPFLQGLDKTYCATVKLGAATDTYDALGAITAEAPDERVAAITEQEVRTALCPFVGHIQQRPPAYSALKREGRRLYELAREGQEIAIEPREIVVHAITLESMALPDLVITVCCGKGTYIRSIAHDLGSALGVHGHLSALRRTRVGPFDVASSSDVFTDLALPPLLPLAEAISHLPAHIIDRDLAHRLRCGQQQALAEILWPEGAAELRFLDGKGGLVAIAIEHGGQRSLARVFGE